MRGRAAGVDDALGDALVVEVRDLLAEDEVLEQRRTAEARLQRVLVVRDWDALIGREHAPVESTRTRSSGPTVGFWPMFGPPLPTLSDPFSSVTVLAPTIGSAGLTDAPWGRRQLRVGIVFRRLVPIERKRGRDVLRSRRLLGEDVAET